MQRQRDCRHHPLAHSRPGVAGGGGEEARDVDVVVVVTVSVGVDLQPRPRPLGPRGEEDRHQQTPHESQQPLIQHCNTEQVNVRLATQEENNYSYFIPSYCS